jgi:hypothetical protein
MAIVRYAIRDRILRLLQREWDKEMLRTNSSVAWSHDQRLFEKV